ncbi:uncharacterized protein [Cardiocondyla obscurior]|uniref:uncharacterized protein n=1 Tax=Cardiocondyla obscurior TaxID=286306 RepID=UPI00396574A0
MSKLVEAVQENNQQIQTLQINTTWVLRGFKNTDNVSCYANTVVQSLLHLSAIRKQLFNCDKSNILRMLMHRYEYGMNNLNTYDVQQDLGESFSMNVKLDALKFLTILCTKYDFVRDLVQQEVTSTTRCVTCHITKTICFNNLFISIPINKLKKKNYNLKELLDVLFSHWHQSDNGFCENCTGNNILYKNELTLTKDIIIIYFVLFLSEEDKVIKAKRNFNISSIPTTKVLVAGQSYKVINAIFHNGLSIDKGHYTNICREGSSNNWIEIDDTEIRKDNGPEVLKIFIYFFTKIDRK